jgi:glutathione peroxidase
MFRKLGEQYTLDQLVILGFPSREFGGQEFETDAEIAEFAASKGFPGILMKLGNVTGPGASEVWKCFVKATSSRAPVWNFDGKFLVSKTGVISLPTDVEADIARLTSE